MLLTNISSGFSLSKSLTPSSALDAFNGFDLTGRTFILFNILYSPKLFEFTNLNGTKLYSDFNIYHADGNWSSLIYSLSFNIIPFFSRNSEFTSSQSVRSS